MTDTAIEPIERPVANGKKKGGGALTRLKARGMTDHAGNGGTLRRRKMRFTMDRNVCEPGAFDEDVVLVVESASVDVELSALKACGDNPAGIVFEMCKRCMVACDGEPVLDGDGSRDLLWEALGMGGRGLLVRKWNELAGVHDGGAQKKADASTELVI